jgi:hypothetical protein
MAEKPRKLEGGVRRFTQIGRFIGIGQLCRIGRFPNQQVVGSIPTWRASASLAPVASCVSRGILRASKSRSTLRNAQCAGVNRRGVANVRVVQGRRSESPWPRVMRRRSRGRRRSVDRGTCRPGIEPRNLPSCGEPTSLSMAEGTIEGRAMRASPDPARSFTLGMHESSAHENREISHSPAGVEPAGRVGKAKSRSPR